MITANERTGRIKYYEKVKRRHFIPRSGTWGDREREDAAVKSARTNRPKAANKVKD